MKIGIAQLDCEPGNIAANTQQIVKRIDQAGNQQCDLVILPEMSDTGYDLPKAVVTATTWDNVSSSAIANAAQRGDIHVAVGLAERDADNIYNTIAVFDRQGQLTAKYRKIHLITADPICEQNHITAGNEPCRFELDGIHCGVMTCYDIRFPELAQALARQSELLIVPAAFPTARIDHWQTITKCRAIENQIYVAACNRVGSDAGVEFGGCSQIVSPTGETLASLDHIEDGLAVCDIQPELVADVRKSLRVWQDRRQNLYQQWNL